MEILTQYVEQVKTLWSNMGNERYFLLIFPAMMVFYFISFVLNSRSTKQALTEFKSKYPQASSILLQPRGNFIAPHEMFLHSIGDQALVFDSVRGKYRYWLVPGEHTLEVSYETRRPGVFYKTVATTYGPIKLSVKVEANKSYVLSFNKAKEFEFKEIE